MRSRNVKIQISLSKKEAEDAAEAAGPSQEELLAEIRDLLANK